MALLVPIGDKGIEWSSKCHYMCIYIPRLVWSWLIYLSASLRLGIRYVKSIGDLGV